MALSHLIDEIPLPPEYRQMKWLLYLLIVSSVPTFSVAGTRARRSPNAAPVSGGSLRRILEIEDHRIAKDRFLATSVMSPSATVAHAAILALGRIGDTSGFDEMATVMNRGNQDLKAIASFSLGLIGGEFPLKLLIQQAALNKSPEVLAPVLVGLGRVGTEKTQQVLANYLNPSGNPRVIESAALGLGLLWSGNSAAWTVPEGALSRLAELAKGGTLPALSSAFALSRYKSDPKAFPIKDVIQALAQSELVYGKGFLLKALAKTKSSEVTDAIVNTLASNKYPPLQIEGAKALSGQDITPKGVNALKTLLGVSDSGVLVTVLDTLSSYGQPASAATDAVENLYQETPSVWVRGAALKTLARLSPSTTRPKLLEILKVKTSPIRPAAAQAIAGINSAEDSDLIASLIRESDLKIIEETLEGIMLWGGAGISSTIKAAMRNGLEKADVGIAAMVSESAEKLRWKDFAASLAATYPLLTRTDQLEAKESILAALAVTGDTSHLALLQMALNDPQKGVVSAAVDAIKAISGKDESARIPLNSTVTETTPSASSIADSVRRRATIVTSRGDIEIKFLNAAPITVTRFVELARKSFYRNTTFHRVVPNFVIQGGDPRGDGYGGPGFLIRDEVSPTRHSRGTVGIATAGKDTGGCQFFINLGPNPHLDGRYTVFAEVTKGMEVADKIEVGDRILSVKIQ